ncbi:MAG: tRNA (adenosine(37)-N6)-threonylcarbamoyltransferase complex dimerization subunit type 1 TsaB, partial [Phycisphaerae bacterium]|nr:tRNA (adenosine(37)-N6)-threonylcarbamoyltransferase complex dimerization subunit type 1 TsaB [Gammaproteobacteria bacterium]NIR96472.1 tRNA (adenosine(37)-N6)-threonylcarbamoyltransferase complex dimerization subunit type 1 TsaB [Gammaproteobacteria bacterium]NIU60125.1 tRNA (adenosine(37)-N6)-threonylcarbamoyltransferase complex dimerization subunit type 1 TsaB [Phycisphaerae bacterium]NIW96459.1 tRNA (adenosine(37)-N6)-threonylcarbamoyltransferase complex dimerization subunit type 1 TsaB [
MRLLAIETATDICSVALYNEGQMLAENTLTMPRLHAEALPSLIEHLFLYDGQTVDSLDVIAVSIGPGSFTGLRIGLSTAKGLMYQHETSLLAIPTLAASAWSVRRTCDNVGVIHHSYREHFFFAAYQLEPSLETITGPVRIAKSDLITALPTELPLVIQAPAETGISVELNNPVLSTNVVSARAIADLAHHQTENWVVSEPLLLEPDYLHEYKAVKYQNPLQTG